MKIFKLLIITFGLALICCSLARSETVKGDMIVAVVNDMIITQSELQEYINFSLLQLASQIEKDKLKEEFLDIAKEALTRLIEDKLILHEAIKAGLIIEDAFIEARLEEIRLRFPSEEEFKKYLLSQNLTLSDIKKNLKDQELMRSIVDKEIRSKIYVSPQETTQFFNEHPEVFSEPEARKVSLVSFSKKEEAEASLKELSQGGDFERVFSKNATYLASEEIRKGDLPPELETKIFKLSVSQNSPIVNIKDKFFIFKILEIIQPRKLSLSQAGALSYKIVFNEKFSRELSNWLDKLKNEAYIVIK
ncbi:MAG: peptidyl-prolyl cis-trans isomerase [Candidatus Omnitrophota bacterium]